MNAANWVSQARPFLNPCCEACKYGYVQGVPLFSLGDAGQGYGSVIEWGCSAAGFKDWGDLSGFQWECEVKKGIA